MPSATASQTIGPFWHLIEHPEWADLTRFGVAGPQVSLTGSVIDGDGNPVIFRPSGARAPTRLGGFISRP